MSRGSGAVAVSAAIALAACADRAPPPVPPPPPAPSAPEPRADAEEAPSPPDRDKHGFPDGPFSLRSKSSGRCLDVSHEEQDLPAGFWAKAGKRAFETKLQKEPGPLLHQWKCSSRITQRFRLKRQLDGGVALRSAATDLCLDAAAMKTKEGFVVQFPCDGSPEQSFRMERGAGGTVTLKSQSTGQCLQPARSTWPEGGLIQQLGCIDAEDQRWVVGP